MSNYQRKWRQDDSAGEYYFRVVGPAGLPLGGRGNTVLGVENTRVVGDTVGGLSGVGERGNGPLSVSIFPFSFSNQFELEFN